MASSEADVLPASVPGYQTIGANQHKSRAMTHSKALSVKSCYTYVPPWPCLVCSHRGVNVNFRIWLADSWFHDFALQLKGMHDTYAYNIYIYTWKELIQPLERLTSNPTTYLLIAWFSKERLE